MNAIILAAGYATRLYPLTLNKAKPLLEVAGRPMIDWVLRTIRNIADLEAVFVVTNSRFAKDFQDWADRQCRQWRNRLKIVNDGSTSDDDKLGAIGDINFVVTREALTGNPLLVLAGDNLLDEPLTDFTECAKSTVATVGVYDVGELEKIKRYANVAINSEGTITYFQEKPEKPRSTLAAIGIYYYSPEVVSLVTTYLAAGNNPDQPGRFVQWLYERKPVKAFQITGRWLDIGSKETLETASEIFAGVS